MCANVSPLHYNNSVRAESSDGAELNTAKDKESFHQHKCHGRRQPPTTAVTHDVYVPAAGSDGAFQSNMQVGFINSQSSETSTEVVTQLRAHNPRWPLRVSTVNTSQMFNCLSDMKMRYIFGRGYFVYVHMGLLFTLHDWLMCLFTSHRILYSHRIFAVTFAGCEKTLEFETKKY